MGEIVTNTNPMTLHGSTSCTNSVFFSTPCIVQNIVWSQISASASVHLADLDGNSIFDGQGEPNVPMRIIDNPVLLANGLRIEGSIGMSTGILYVWVR